jgi:catechol-2,3-dioxygenase
LDNNAIHHLANIEAINAGTLELNNMKQVESTVDAATRPSPVRVKKLGHVVLQVRDVERSIKFYTEVLNFRVSDRQQTGGAFLTGVGDHQASRDNPKSPTW